MDTPSRIARAARPWPLGLGILLLLPGCQGLQAKHFTQDSWRFAGRDGRHYSTDHFEIYTTAANEQLAAALPGFMEAAHRNYREFVSPYLPANRISTAGPPPTLYLFHDRETWQRFVDDRYPVRRELYARIKNGGITEGTTSIIFYTQPASTLATVAHEGWHQFAAQEGLIAMPPWLSEGLACTFEDYDVTRAQPRWNRGQNRFRQPVLEEIHIRESLLPLRDLLSTDIGEVVAQDDSRWTQAYYAHAWALVLFLEKDRSTRDAFARMMRDLFDGSFALRIQASAIGHAAEPFGLTAFRHYFGEPSLVEPAYRLSMLQRCRLQPGRRHP